MKESEIRKRDVFNQYLKLVDIDVDVFFKNTEEFDKVACPACGKAGANAQFKKSKFTYCLCDSCQTLFVNPRPRLSDLIRFYSESPSTSYWVNDFFMPVMDVRREKIFKPRAKFVHEQFKLNANTIIGDIGAGFGLFLSELKQLNPSSEYVAIEPSIEMAKICQQKGLSVVNLPIEEVPENQWSFDLLTCFELFEHLHDPGLFLSRVFKLLKPKGRFLMTTLNGNGFDIQLLWENSKSVSPPHHLNFFNPTSVKILLEKIGFTDVVVTTPGLLDWDIVDGMIKEEGADLGRFWNLVSKNVTESGKSQLQDWISSNLLSSHMKVVATKPD